MLEAMRTGEADKCLAMLEAGADAAALSTFFWKVQAELKPAGVARHMGKMGVARLIDGWAQATEDQEAIERALDAPSAPARSGRSL